MLCQGVKHQLQPLVRSFVSSSSTNAAAPALASVFGFTGSRTDVPLSERLPAVTEPPRGSTPASAPTLQTSALSDGVKLATIDTISPMSTLGVFVEGGSSAETGPTAGAAQVLAAMAFKTTANRSTFRVTRELEKIGATSYSCAGREHVAFAVDFVRLNQREAVEVLTDAVFNPKYSYWEVRDTLEAVKEQLATELKNPVTVVSEVLHRAAFDGGLGNGLVADPAQLSSFDNEVLKEYIAATLSPSRVVLAGVGVDHQHVAQHAGSLVHVSGSAAAAPSSKYVGGAMNILSPAAPVTYVALGFEAKGGLSDAKSAAIAGVIKALLDEARPTLPHKRLESDVLKSLTPFANLYKATGVVGLMASSMPCKAGAAVDAVCKKVEAVAKGVSEAQLAHAKALALGELKASTASTAGLLSAIGSQILLTGKYSTADVAAKLQGVTAAEVSSYVATMLKSSPTLVAYGNLAGLPRADSVAKRFA